MPSFAFKRIFETGFGHHRHLLLESFDGRIFSWIRRCLGLSLLNFTPFSWTRRVRRGDFLLSILTNKKEQVCCFIYTFVTDGRVKWDLLMIQTLVVNVFGWFRICFYRDYKDWEKEWFGVRIRREQSIDQRRRNLAAVGLETRMFVNFGAYSDWWKIKCFLKCFLSVSDIRFTIRQKKHRFWIR